MMHPDRFRIRGRVHGVARMGSWHPCRIGDGAGIGEQVVPDCRAEPYGHEGKGCMGTFRAARLKMGSTGLTRGKSG